MGQCMISNGMYRVTHKRAQIFFPIVFFLSHQLTVFHFQLKNVLTFVTISQYSWTAQLIKMARLFTRAFSCIGLKGLVVDRRMRLNLKTSQKLKLIVMNRDCIGLPQSSCVHNFTGLSYTSHLFQCRFHKTLDLSGIFIFCLLGVFACTSILKSKIWV